MKQERFEGGCLCGAVRYCATSAPVRGVICHCGMCRRHSGAPFLAFVHFPLETFSWINEAPERYRSSRFAERGFCARCGSTISMHEQVLLDRVQVTLGSLDEPGRAPPDDQVWASERIAWLDRMDELRSFERSSDAVASKAED